MKRRAVFTVDYEGHHGMPRPSAGYDLSKSTRALVGALERQNVGGVFFVVGRLVDERPELIEYLAAAGHEVGLHGVDHEHLDCSDKASLPQFADELDRLCDTVAQIGGKRPRGFRSPFLMAPTFYSPQVYRVLAELGFTWVSNRSIRFPEELFRPDRLRTGRPWHLLAKKGVPASRLGTLVLNPRLLYQEKQRGHLQSPSRWLLSGAPPFHRRSLVELPELSPMDCDLLGLPDPTVDSDPDLLSYARWALINRFHRSGEWFCLTVHDWISGTGNRLANLEAILHDLGQRTELQWVRPGLENESVWLADVGATEGMKSDEPS